MSKSFDQLLQENAPFEEFKEFIESGNFDANSLATLLEEAVLTKKIDKRIPLLLISSGANVNKRPYYDYGSILSEAIFAKCGPEIISALISAGADIDINKADIEGDMPLHIAMQKKANKATIQALIEAGADVNAKSDGKTPLHYAAIKKHPKAVVQLLIDAGADVNAKSSYYEDTPLHYAAELNCPKAVVQLLINAGADVNARNRDGKTPLREAQSAENQEMIDFLIEHGAKQTLVDLISSYASVAEIKAAIAEGADVNEKNGWREETPLQVASRIPMMEDVVRLLIEVGAVKD